MIRIFVAKILMIKTDRHCLDLHFVAVTIRKTTTLHRVIMALNNAGKANLVVSKANGSLKNILYTGYLIKDLKFTGLLGVWHRKAHIDTPTLLPGPIEQTFKLALRPGVPLEQPGLPHSLPRHPAPAGL